jgi:hypothetical protein
MFAGRCLVEAISFGIGALALAVVMWVYFDAAERGRNAFLWVVGMLWSGGLLLVIYLLVRNSGPQRPTAPGYGVRQYLYIASFCGAFLVSIGFSVGLGALFMSPFSDEGFDSGTRNAVASGIVAGLVGMAVLVVHWRIAERRLDELPDEEFRAQFATRRLALQTTAAVNGLSAVLAALVCFGGALAALLGATYAAAEAWVTAAAPLLVTGGVAFASWKTFSQTEHGPRADRFRSIPEPGLVSPPLAPAASLPPPPATVPRPPTFVAPPPAPRPPSPEPSRLASARYCGQCGSEVVGSTDLFCRSCGTRLQQPHSAAHDAS